MKDVGDQANVAKAQQEHDVAEFLSKEDFKDLLNITAFRKFLWTMLNDCDIYSMSFFGDVHDGLVREGQRKIGLLMIGKLEQVDPSVYPNLLLEFGKEDNV